MRETRSERPGGRATLERALDHLELALEAGRMGTWHWDLSSGVVEWSKALEEMFGLEPGTFSGGFADYASLIHAEDRPEALAGIEEAMAGQTRFTYRYRIVRPDGEVRWIEGAGLPALAPDGEIEGLTGVCLDITDRHEAEQRLRRERDLVGSLYRVGQAVASRLELEEVVQVATDSATALTGAAFGAFFYNVIDDQTGESYQLFCIAGAPRERFEGFPMPRSTPIFAPTYEGLGIVRLDDVTTDPRFGLNAPYYGLPEGHLPVRSYLAVPVVLSDGEVAGGLFFGHPEPGRFTELDEHLVAGIATQAAIGIDNSRRYEREHAAAHTLQRSLLPAKLPDLPDLDVAALYQPGVDGVDVGGDWYDVVPLDDDRTLFVVGDVVGRGIPAAAVMGSLRHATRAHALDGDSPAEILCKLSRLIDVHRDAQFATVLCMSHDRRTHELTLASAGHLPAVMTEPGGEPRLAVVPPGVPVGVTTEASYEEAHLSLGADTRLLMYTDGLMERRGEIIDEGFDRLLGAVHATRDASIQAQLDALLSRLVPGTPTDDITVLGIQRTA